MYVERDFFRMMKCTYGLTKAEAVIVQAMFESEPANTRRLLGWLAAFDGTVFRDPGIVRVHVCRARQKLAAHGIVIHRGNSHQPPYMDREHVQKLRQRIEARLAA